MMRSGSFRKLALTLAAAIVATTLPLLTPAQRAYAGLPAGGMTPAAVSSMFTTYGNAGNHWTGGDSTVSVPLPDGRVAWLFSDTFLGTVAADGSRPSSAPLVNNTIVVQDSTSLVDTKYGGTPAAPEALVKPQQPDEFFWVADGIVEGGALKVLYNRYRHYGSGDLDVEITGTSLVTFALPALTVSSVVDLPVGKAITWGSALLTDGGYTYVYGASSGLGGMKFGHLARVPAGDLGAAWQYWNGSAWTDSLVAATRLISGVGTAYSVEKLGSQYVLITQETNSVFDPQLVAYTAPAPTGPFTGPIQLLTAPEQQPGSQHIVYHARTHQELARPGKILLSYDVNSLDHDEIYRDVTTYRPRFAELDWPRPQPSPVPAAPAGFTGTGNSAGVVHLGWSAVSGATGYRVHSRDVTGGQTHFVRKWQPVTGTSIDLSGLITGHRYEFKVTAANANGEGPFTPTVTVTSHIVRDASVIRLANRPNSVAGVYQVAFKPNPAVRVSGVRAFAEDLLAQTGGGTLERVFPELLNGFSARLTQQQAIDLAGHPDVDSVEQDYQVLASGALTAMAAGVQGDPGWGLDRIDQRTGRDGLYHYPTEGIGVHAYVLDSGIRPTQKDFTGRLGAGANTTVYPSDNDTADCSGHGTGVAGVLGGTHWGVAKKVTIHPVRVLACFVDTDGTIYEQGTATWIEDGLEWVRQNMQSPAVVNMSFGTPMVGTNEITNLDRAVSRLAGTGATVVTSAGNGYDDEVNGDDACTVTPAHADKVLGTDAIVTVGAITQSDVRHPQSNYGPCIDIWAPGKDVPTDDWLNDEDVPPAQPSGSSLAAPHVSGAAALILEAHPDWSGTQVQEALFTASTKDILGDLRGGQNRLLFVEQAPTQAPSNLTATPKPDGTVGLTWTGVPPQGQTAVRYQVSMRNTSAGDTEFVPRNGLVSATSSTVGDLNEGDRYEFVVAAVTGTGTSPQSNVAAATAHMAPPGAPTGLTATALADGSIKLNWVSPAPSQELWFTVEQRDVSAGETGFTPLELPVLTCCTMTVGLLQDDDQYQFRVIASNAGGPGPASAPAGAVSNYPSPAAPTGLSAVAGDGEVTLNWTASPTPNVWYWIYQRDVTNTEATPTQLPLPITDCCTAKPGYLANNVEYEFSVTAVGQGGESVASNKIRVTPRKPLPGKVTGLTATPNTDGTITLNWTEPANGPHWYTVYQKLSTDTDYTEIPLPVTTCCTYTAGLLTQDKQYDFRVKASNGRDGPLSDPVRATAHYNPPAAPRNLTGQAAGDGTIDLDWDPPSAGSFYYWVYYRNISAGQGTFTKSAYPTDKTYVTTGPFPNNDVIELKVSAANPGGEGPASTTIRVTAHGGLPAPPSGLTATAGNGQVTLRWTASPTPSVYYWLEYRSAGGAWQRNSIPIQTCCTHTVSQLTNGTTYDFRLRATNAIGDSVASNVATARPMPPLPSAPSGLTATAGNGQVTLRWTASPTPSVYYWVEYQANGGAWQRISIPVQTCCTHTVSLLTNGTTYGFRVKATNLAGDSAPTNTATARPMPPLPSAPSGLTATAGDGRVTLRWTASPSPSVYYWVEYQIGSGAWRRSKYPVASCCTNTVTYLTNGTTYGFRVKATNLAGDSAPTNTATARPMPPLPTAPTNLATSVSGTTVRLTWGASTPSNVYYWIYMRDASRNESFHRQAYPATTTSVNISPLTGGHRFEFYVVAANLAGQGPASNHAWANPGPTDQVSRCASAASSWRYVNKVTVYQFGYPSAKICGFRDGDHMSITMSWNSSGYHIFVASFAFDLYDCTTGALKWYYHMAYEDNPTQTSDSRGRTVTIYSPTRYRLMVRGDGKVAGPGLLYNDFSSGANTPPGIAPLKAETACF